jgi:hypothetical protein
MKKYFLEYVKEYWSVIFFIGGFLVGMGVLYNRLDTVEAQTKNIPDIIQRLSRIEGALNPPDKLTLKP